MGCGASSASVQASETALDKDGSPKHKPPPLDLSIIKQGGLPSAPSDAAVAVPSATSSEAESITPLSEDIRASQKALRASLLGRWRCAGPPAELLLFEDAGSAGASLAGTFRNGGDVAGAELEGGTVSETTVFTGCTSDEGIIFSLLLNDDTAGGGVSGGGAFGWYSETGHEAEADSWTGQRMRSGSGAADGFAGVWILTAHDGEESRLQLEATAEEPLRLKGEVSVLEMEASAGVTGGERRRVAALRGRLRIEHFLGASEGASGDRRQVVAFEDGDGGLRLWVSGGTGVVAWNSYKLQRA